MNISQKNAKLYEFIILAKFWGKKMQQKNASKKCHNIRIFINCIFLRQKNATKKIPEYKNIH